MKRVLFSIFLLLSIGVGTQVTAQGWQTEVNLPNVDNLPIMVRPTMNGEYIAVVRTNNPYLVYLDSYGNIIWTNPIAYSGYFKPYDVVQAQNGDFLVCGFTNNFPVVIRTDGNGSQIWTQTFTGLSWNHAQSIRETSNGDIIVVCSGGAPSIGMSLLKLDPAGYTLWSRSYFQGEYSVASTMETTFDGGQVIVGQVDVGSDRKAFTLKTNANGDSLWTYLSPLGNLESASYSDVEQMPDSGFIMVGTVFHSNFGSQSPKDILTTRIDENGLQVWSDRHAPNTSHYGGSIAATPDGGFILLFRSNNFGTQIKKYDANRVLEWDQGINMVTEADAKGCLNRTPDGNFTFVANDNVTGLPGATGYIIRMDSVGRIFPHLIQGNVYHDQDSNCIRGINEDGLTGWVVEAHNLNTGRTFYSFTDSDGYYEMQVDSGTLEWGPSHNSIASAYWGAPSCGSNTHTYNFGSGNDSIQQDFSEIETIFCPMLWVDLGIGQLVQCSVNTYQVIYGNYGTTTAHGVTIELDLGPDMVMANSNVPWTNPLGGNLVYLHLDSVPSNSQSGLYFSVDLDTGCNATEIFEARCITAHITPDSFCTPIDPIWDSSSVAVTADCIADSIVRLAAYNVGTSYMSTFSHVIIVEDNILRLDTHVAIPAGDSLEFFHPANGSTWLIQADQSPGHPGNSNPSAFVEGCGLNSSGTFSKGWALSYPLDNGDLFRTTFCDDIGGPYDPNAKEVLPRGRGVNHFIDMGQQLNYTLHFQNTGNLPAVNVVIIDTLPVEVDPATIMPGVSSHPYTFELYGSGIAKFTFANIMLPDSFSDEPGSKGFVKFSIEQTTGLAHMARIKNAVEIYFDRNAPIITDTAWVTLGDDAEGYAIVHLDPIDYETHEINVYPNPFRDLTILKLDRTYWQGKLEIYDLQGKLIHQQTADQTDQFVFRANGLPSGVYLYRVTADDQLLGTGRLSVLKP